MSPSPLPAVTTISPLDRALHWTIAIGMIVMVVPGILSDQLGDHPARYFVFNSHVALGSLMLVLATWRVGRRLGQGFPKPLGPHALYERAMAHLVHTLLLGFTVLAPLSGVARVIGRGRPLQAFGITILPAGPGNEALAALARSVHSGPILIFLLGAVFLLHVAGALKHQFIDRDGTLARMAGRTRSA